MPIPSLARRASVSVEGGAVGLTKKFIGHWIVTQFSDWQETQRKCLVQFAREPGPLTDDKK